VSLGEPADLQSTANLDSTGAVGRPDGGHMTWCDYQADEADRFRQLGCQLERQRSTRSSQAK
jgi:hypothetical protein